MSIDFWARPNRHDMIAPVALALVAALALTMALPPDPVEAGACKVRNVNRGGSYEGIGAAVKAARNGDKLAVRGTCVGRARIENKRLVITGAWSKKYGAPKIRATGLRAVEVRGKRARVTIIGLTIQGRTDVAPKRPGGGIEIDGGVLRLKNVVVKGFRARGEGGAIYVHKGILRLQGKTKVVNNKAISYGGGAIYNADTVFMSGTSLVRGNSADKAGGGILNGGTLVLKDSSSILGNTAGAAGGGISSSGELRLEDDAAVRGNTGRNGGGIWANGVAVLEGRSSVSGNVANEWGGGLLVHGQLTMRDDSSVSANTAVAGGGLMAALGPTLIGVVCAPPEDGANVFGNTPGNCDAY